MLMLTCDLHVHTNHSRDGTSSVLEMIKRAEYLGLDAIAITDHDTISGVVEAESFRTDLIIIPGIEVTTHEGHLIILGVSEVIPKGKDFFETVATVHELGGVAILPHPFHMMRHGVAVRKGVNWRDAFRAVDAIEIFNSRYIIGSANKKAKKGAKILGKPCTGGSDAHETKFLGFGWTHIDSEPDTGSILQAIRDGKTEAGGRKTPVKSYTRQSVRSSWKRVKKKVIRR